MEESFRGNKHLTHYTECSVSNNADELDSDGSDSVLHHVHLRKIIAHDYRKYTDISTRRQLNTKGNSGKIIFIKHPRSSITALRSDDRGGLTSSIVWVYLRDAACCSSKTNRRLLD